MKFIRSSVALILVSVILASVLPISAFAADTVLTATKINTTRGEGDLVVYTPSFGSSTNTNEWGAEAVIDATGKCIYCGTNGNNEIPVGGFVISGHDSDDVKNKTAVLGAIKVGMYAAFNEKLMKITISDSPIITANEFEVSISADGTNCSRGENMLVIYNRSGSKTGTNVWGYEVVVTDGIVTAIGGNDNTVPAGQNSYILSGHGTKAEWLVKNVVLGMSVTESRGEYTFKYDSKAASAAVEVSLASLKEKLEYAKSTYALVDTDSASSEIKRIEKELNAAVKAYDKDGDGDKLAEVCNRLQSEMEDVSLSLTESNAVEYRGVWLRPVQTTAQEVDSYVQKLYDAGINLICIETLYDSCMIMPMPEDSLFVQNPKWAGFDMLQAFIDSCHSRGMELHLWLPIFYVGHKNSNAKYSVGYKKPSWLSKNNIGTNFPTDSDSSDFYMLDPSNSEACDFLIETYRYILETYDVDGLEMDYIRYWARGSEDWGYNQGLVDAFAEKYGVTPEYDTGASYWKNWCDFRASYVTNMVYRIRELVDEVRPNVVLSADVAADEAHAKGVVYQYYHEWLDAGVLDCIHPMAYGNSYYDRITEINEMCGDTCYLAVGLGTQDSSITSDALVKHTEHIVNIGGNGAVFFEATTYLARNLYSMLEVMYSDRATVPTADEALSIYLETEYKRIDELMVKSGAISKSTASKLKEALMNYASGEGTKADIEEIIATVSKDNARDRLNKTATTLARLVYLRGITEREVENPGVVDIPVIPSVDEVSENTSDNSSDNSAEHSQSEVSDAEASENSESEQSEPVSPIVIIVSVAAAAIIIIILSAILCVKKNKKK